jgi:DNA primase catalytic core
MSTRDDVDTVRSRTDILQVVAPYVALKRSGKIWKGLCPFHNEKTPSFQVNPDFGHWHCFGQCGEGGDVFKFIQKIDNLTFPEALERLALKAGVTLTRESNRTSSVVPSGEKDRLYAALNAAVDYYRSSLSGSQHALDYLSQRNISTETIDYYQLGYAGGDWDTLPRFLDQRGVRRDDAVKAGILIASDRGGHFDKLRGRIVFPIVDVQNRPVAFGGRLIQSEPERPKYLNSSETPLFSKSKTLYGLSRARKAISELGEAIIVEGYLDVIACHQGGFLNTVATLGTSLTEEHALIIGRLARRVLLAFDSDAAGVKAALRANSIFEAQEIEVRILAISEGDDPDSMISSGRSEDFRYSIANAVPLNEYRLKQILAGVDSGVSERDREVLFQREIMPILRSTRSVIERERYVRMCAPLHPFYATGSALAEDQIRQEIDGKRVDPNSRQFAGNRGQNGVNQGGYYSRDYKRPVSTRQSVISVVSGIEKAEEVIIQTLIDANPDHICLLTERLRSGSFVRPAFGKLAEHLLRMPGAEGAQAALQDPELSSDPAVAETLLGRHVPIPGITIEVISDSLQLLTRHAEDQTLAKLRELSRSGDLQANELYTKIMRERKGARTDDKLST